MQVAVNEVFGITSAVGLVEKEGEAEICAPCVETQCDSAQVIGYACDL